MLTFIFRWWLVSLRILVSLTLSSLCLVLLIFLLLTLHVLVLIELGLILIFVLLGVWVLVGEQVVGVESVLLNKFLFNRFVLDNYILIVFRDFDLLTCFIRNLLYWCRLFANDYVRLGLVVVVAVVRGFLIIISPLNWQIILGNLPSLSACAALTTLAPLTGWSARLFSLLGEQCGLLVCKQVLVVGLHLLWMVK